MFFGGLSRSRRLSEYLSLPDTVKDQRKNTEQQWSFPIVSTSDLILDILTERAIWHNNRKLRRRWCGTTEISSLIWKKKGFFLLFVCDVIFEYQGKKHVYTHQRNTTQVSPVCTQEMSTACGTWTCLCLLFQSCYFATLGHPVSLTFEAHPGDGSWCQQEKRQLQLGTNRSIWVRCAKSQPMGFQA